MFNLQSYHHNTLDDRGVYPFQYSFSVAILHLFRDKIVQTDHDTSSMLLVHYFHQLECKEYYPLLLIHLL